MIKQITREITFAATLSIAPSEATAAATESAPTDPDDRGAPPAGYVQQAYLDPGPSRKISLPAWAAVCKAALPRPTLPLPPFERRRQRAGASGGAGGSVHWPGAEKEVQVTLPVHKDVALRHVDRKSNRKAGPTECVLAGCMRGDCTVADPRRRRRGGHVVTWGRP